MARLNFTSLRGNANVIILSTNQLKVYIPGKRLSIAVISPSQVMDSWSKGESQRKSFNMRPEQLADLD